MSTALHHPPQALQPEPLPSWWAELITGSGIAPDVAAANVAAFGPGTDRHWETERALLVHHQRRAIQTSSTTTSGLPQAQPGFLSERLINLQRRYQHLQHGGWRTISAGLPGLPVFDQWKPVQPRRQQKAHGFGPAKAIKYEAPPGFPDGGGALLPRVPERCWQLICQRQGLPFPDAATVAAGFWPWALATPGLELLLCEGWKKALAAISAGWAAIGLPGITMGFRGNAETGRRLIAELQALACTGRRWLIAFDAEARPSTARKVAAAAGATAQALRAAGGRVAIARLPLLPSTDKTGLDDLLAAAGPEALERALANTGPRAVLPTLRPADQVAPAGQWLGVACPIPSPEVAPLVVIQAPMGCGKSRAVRDRVAPLQAEGVPLLTPYHRRALGKAGSDPETGLGVPWCPPPGSDERLEGIAGCWDSWCPESSLQITGQGWKGGALVLEEWAQACEHLLLSTGTTLAKRRSSVLRTAGEQTRWMRQTIAPDAQLPDWAVRLLEQLSGHRAYVIRSDHQPMAGRPLHCPDGFNTAEAAALAFRARWAQLVAAGEPFLCWTSAQAADVANSPQRLAALHQQLRPGDLVDVIDSTTEQLAAELATDPDGFAERRMAEARQLGVSWALYTSPAMTSGLSFERWQPAAVIAYAGGRIAPEHVAQAAARIRCPQVPAYLFAPERCPGGALQVGSGSTDPDELIADLRAVADPLLGQLQDAGDPWLQAWGELGATRNRQRFAYRATISGLLEREGWVLQAPGPAPCPITAAKVTAALKAAADAAHLAGKQAINAAPLLDAAAAAELKRHRQRTPEEQAALDRFEIAERWALGDAPPSLELLDADDDGLRDRLRLGWLLTTPDAAALVPEHDWQQVEALDPIEGQPFAPDRLRVTLGSKLGALASLGIPQLLQRFAAGEVIAANDPAVLALHATATAHRRQLAAAAKLSPALLPTGTLRALLAAVGWKLQQAGRIKTRSTGRDAYTYRAQPMTLPEGVNAQALQALWRSELQAPAAGAKSPPVVNPYRGEKSPTPPPPPPPLRLRDGFRALLRALAPPPPRSAALAAA